MICYAKCIASAGAASFVGASVLPYFGFGQGGVAPGGFAANLMALNGGEMKKNGFVPMAQSIGAKGKSWKKHAKKFCENYCQSQ